MGKSNDHKNKPFSIGDRLKSFVYASRGIWLLIKKEHNARIHLLAILIIVPLGFYFQLDAYEWIAIVFAIGMVVFSEIMNTAIEHLADIVDPNWNDKIGEVKDFAAGATLIAAIVSVVIGAIVFIPKIFEL